jgi:hypothetical protein
MVLTESDVEALQRLPNAFKQTLHCKDVINDNIGIILSYLDPHLSAAFVEVFILVLTWRTYEYLFEENDLLDTFDADNIQTSTQAEGQ